MEGTEIEEGPGEHGRTPRSMDSRVQHARLHALAPPLTNSVTLITFASHHQNPRLPMCKMGPITVPIS